MSNPSMPIDVLVKDQGWIQIIKSPQIFCERAIEAAADGVPALKSGEVSIALVNDAEIQALNKSYRRKDRPTNVLSFPDHGPAPVLGDIAIARETVAAEAVQAGITAKAHLAHMLVHGFLHLQGYDHEKNSDAEIMEALEIKALRVLNIDNPYEINEHLEP